MITITRFSVDPDPTDCGTPSTITVQVTWGGGGQRRIKVCVNIPGSCRFDGQSQVCDTQQGRSPLTVTFQGAFTCSIGTHNPELDATTDDLGGKDSDSAKTFVKVRC